MFWKRKSRVLSPEEQEGAVNRGWNACLDEILKCLKEHSWVTEEGDEEIFCDGCGTTLSRKLQELRR